MDLTSLEIIKTELEMDMQRNITLMESTTRDNGRMTGGMVKEHCSIQMEQCKLENGNMENSEDRLREK